MHPSKLKPLPSDASPNPVRGGRFGLRLSTLACAAALVAGLQVSEAWALALGRATVQSGLGEPLRAEIDVPSITAEEAASLSLRIGGAEAFRAAGMEMNALLSDVQFNVVRRADGRTTIRLQSTRPVSEPFLDLMKSMDNPLIGVLVATVFTAIGDVIALLDVGAYALENMTEYCGRQAAAAVLVDLQQGSRLIRRRAEYQDLLAYDVD